MKIQLWAHGGSFWPSWRKSELDWIHAYAEELRRLGAEVSFAHSLQENVIPEATVHVFGSTHLETLAWLKGHCRQLWLSPMPFTASAPWPREANWFGRASRRIWRMFLAGNLAPREEQSHWRAPGMIAVTAAQAACLPASFPARDRLRLVPSSPQEAARTLFAGAEANA